MPDMLDTQNIFYLRATPITRALESVQHSFSGMYPPSQRSFTTPTIVTRLPTDETLFPNTTACDRFAELSRAFAKRSASRWNDSPEMEYINQKIGKWMPESSPTVKVDSHPRLSGIMDTINSTLAHGPQTRLPPEFYDKQVVENIDKICTEEWFAGYNENQEYRLLGIGGLLGDVVRRMIGHIEHAKSGVIHGIPTESVQGPLGDTPQAEVPIKFAMSGAHDTTIAGFLASMGAFDPFNDKWPSYTSHIAVELFKKVDTNEVASDTTTASFALPTSSSNSQSSSFPLSGSSANHTTAASSNEPSSLAPPSESIARKPTPELTPEEVSRFKDYYVRLRYNDRPVTVPGCRAPGKHLEGNETFCTLDEFKRIADKFTPKDWKTACDANKDGNAFPVEKETAGF